MKSLTTKPQNATILEYGVSVDTFRKHWSAVDPLVVSGINQVLHDMWTPSASIQAHGPTIVELVDCETNHHKNSMMKEFLSGFGNRAFRPRSGAIQPLKAFTLLDLSDDSQK